LARKLREKLEEWFGPGWEGVLEVLTEVRRQTLPLLPNLRERSRRWSHALDLDEAARLVGSGRRDELRTRLVERLLAAEDVA
jgi:siroheme synthase (precorrin-2 oxidase/ferrochelatase)